MKKLLLVNALVLMFAVSGNACFNGFGESFGESVRMSQASFPVPNGHPVNTKDEDVTETLDVLKRGYENGEFEFSIDYGLYLVYDKQYEEAEKVFRNIVGKWPNKYEAASNFGTILEVNGKNAEALKWIKKAISINANSHDGSEWLHVKILEAKLNPAKKWSGATLTGVDFGENMILASSKTKSELIALQKQLFFQLNERVTFIQPKDPFIAALMFELGNVTFDLGQISDALSIYKKAKKYGFEDP
ncbi:MAG: tetratricopeptide repeat protein [Bacteroidetes bacterium]|nr:tetratricopeptide repeat protein [Bacteroidota bacterium]